jgi:hypothetical protein
VSKWLWVILLAAAASLFYFSHNPPADGNGGRVCEKGTFIEGYCDASVYYYDECVNGFYRAAQLNCSPGECVEENWGGGPETVCVAAVTDASPSPSVEPSPEATVEPGEEGERQGKGVEEWLEGFVSCGDGNCDKPEGCASCPEDCECGDGEYCREEWNSCEAVNDCGDGECREGEECCSDCGCGKGTVCDFESQECFELPESMPEAEQIAAGVEDYLIQNEYYNQSVAAVSYYVSGGEAFALVITDCPPSESGVVCDLWVTVNATGGVVSVARPA